MFLFSSLRSLVNRLHDDLEKIGSGIEAATAEYKAENTKEKPAPVMTGLLHRPQSEIDNEEARAARDEGRDNVRLAVEVLGLCIASILAVATIGLWMVTRESTRIAGLAAKAAQEGARASADQVAVTKSSIEASIAQFRLDQRAWLGVVQVLPPEGFDGGQSLPYLGAVATNSGKTPALEVSTVVAAWPFKAHEKFIPYYGVTNKSHRPSVTVIQPNMLIRLRTSALSSRPFNADEIVDLKKGGKDIPHLRADRIQRRVWKYPRFPILYVSGARPENFRSLRYIQ